MDFIDQIKVIGEKVARLTGQITTEEATMNAFILPFIADLGYDPLLLQLLLTPHCNQ